MNTKLITVVFLFVALAGHAQQKTISGKEKTEREITSLHKVMLIPFEPRLYLSEIDHNIHAETRLSPREIRNRFRDGINEQLYKAFRDQKINVVDLMEDTVKYKKDTEKLYQYIAYDYLKVPDQDNYKTPKKETEEKKIQKGQLTVETNSDNRFMHVRVTEKNLIPALSSKYKTDVFVFIGQLDIRASGQPNINPSQTSANRKIVVHYTVYAADGNEINSGVAEEEFDPALNNPKKILDKHFSRIAGTIVARVNRALGSNPGPGAAKGGK